jgi:hypothetical protein
MKYRAPKIREHVAGDPVRLQGRILVPVARVEHRTERKALVGTSEQSGTVRHWVRIRPVGLIESTSQRVRRYAIHDPTRRAFWMLGAVALVLAVLTVYLWREPGRKE